MQFQRFERYKTENAYDSVGLQHNVQLQLQNTKTKNTIS